MPVFKRPSLAQAASRIAAVAKRPAANTGEAPRQERGATAAAADDHPAKPKAKGKTRKAKAQPVPQGPRPAALPEQFPSLDKHIGEEERAREPGGRAARG
eukprot:4301313-Alexandrium_andersonii.AAC.1